MRPALIAALQADCQSLDSKNSAEADSTVAVTEESFSANIPRIFLTRLRVFSGISPEKLDKSKLLNGERMIVAPKDIDLLVKNASYLLALSINCALQPTLTAEEIYTLM